MHVFSQAFSLPKNGNSLEEYEDAFWPSEKIDGKYSSFAIAVADGATEASFSGLWARLLVRAYCNGRLEPERFDRSVAQLGRVWSKCVSKRPLPWFAAEKLQYGSYSSLLGFRAFSPEEGTEVGKWHALAIGDSCIFQVRNDECVDLFPIAASVEFTSRPVLLRSIPPAVPEGNSFHKYGSWEPGDTFFAMSDALACWFIQSIERQERPWATFFDLDTSDQQETFAEFVGRLRSNKALKNDDVTLVRVTIE